MGKKTTKIVVNTSDASGKSKAKTLTHANTSANDAQLVGFVRAFNSLSNNTLKSVTRVTKETITNEVAPFSYTLTNDIFKGDTLFQAVLQEFVYNEDFKLDTDTAISIVSTTAEGTTLGGTYHDEETTVSLGASYTSNQSIRSWLVATNDSNTIELKMTLGDMFEMQNAANMATKFAEIFTEKAAAINLEMEWDNTTGTVTLNNYLATSGRKIQLNPYMGDARVGKLFYDAYIDNTTAGLTVSRNDGMDGYIYFYGVDITE